MRTFKSYRLSLEKFSIVRGGTTIPIEESPNAEPEEGAKPWYGKEER